MCFIHVLHVLNMPMDASLACWALFYIQWSPPVVDFKVTQNEVVKKQILREQS